MNRRTLIGAAVVGAAFPLHTRVATGQTSTKTKNVVLISHPDAITNLILEALAV
jgi:hypothetical protein